MSLDGISVCIMVIIFGGFGSFSEFTYEISVQTLLLTSHPVHDFDVSSFITTYFPILLFAALFVGYKFWNKSKMVDYANMDFVSGSSIEIPDDVS
jgi:amino acid transporter